MPDDKTDPSFGNADREPTDEEAADAEKTDLSEETPAPLEGCRGRRRF